MLSMWMWSNKNIVKKSILLDFIFDSPKWSLKFKKNWLQKYSKKILFSGKLYFKILKFILFTQPIFFISLSNSQKFEKKVKYTPSLLYISPNNRNYYAYNIFNFIFSHFRDFYKNPVGLRLSPELITLFSSYYKKILERIIYFYIIKN